jgi:hypothetical protein
MIYWMNGGIAPHINLSINMEVSGQLHAPACFTPRVRDPITHWILSNTLNNIYGLDNWGSMVWFLVVAGYFSLHHHVQNGSGAHHTSYPMGTRGSFPGGKWLGHEADHSLPSSAEDKECVELHLHSPIHFHSMVLGLKKRHTTLPLPSLTVILNYPVLGQEHLSSTFKMKYYSHHC